MSPEQAQGKPARSPQRPLLAGRHLLPHAERRAAVPGRFRRRAGAQARAASSPGSLLSPPAGPPAGARAAGAQADGQEPRRSLPVGGRDAGRSGEDPRASLAADGRLDAATRTRSRGPRSRHEAATAGNGNGARSGVALAARNRHGQLPRSRAGLIPRTLLLTGMISVLVGAALRVDGAPARSAGWPSLSPAGPPGLAIEPRWSSIPKQDSGEDQYRYAQLPPRRGSGGGLACRPRFHSHSPKWISKAYLQLARRLYRRDDQDRCRRSRRRSSPGKRQTPDQELARIIASSRSSC